MTTKATVFLFVVALLLAAVNSTTVFDCATGKPIKGGISVKISNCSPPPCKLRRLTTATIEQHFIPDHDIESVTNAVHAVILLGVPLPFLGVDSTDACPNIVKADDGTPGCPLKQGIEYIYNNSFPVLAVYPTVSLTVYWALKENPNSTITCFQVPAKIS